MAKRKPAKKAKKTALTKAPKKMQKKVLKKAPRKPKAKKIKKVRRLPAKELKAYKALLIKERERVGGELTHIAENTLNKSQRDLSGDLSGYSYHMADMASDDYERDFSLERATAEQGALFSIDEALKRIGDGVYGLCQSCGKAISKQRLKALPYTPCCIECQKKSDMT